MVVHGSAFNSVAGLSVELRHLTLHGMRSGRSAEQHDFGDDPKREQPQALNNVRAARGNRTRAKIHWRHPGCGGLLARMAIFLACYDYGTGGVWLYVEAESEEDIGRRYPALTIVPEPPPWWSEEDEREMRAKLGDPFWADWLARLPGSQT